MSASNGLREASFHVDEIPPTVAAEATAADDAAARRVDVARMSPEEAARLYLESALSSPALPEMTVDAVAGEQPDFDLIGVDAIPLTGTQAVKFRQRYHRIPVYGSLVTVELDRKNRLLAIQSSLGEPDVEPVARISPERALASVRRAARHRDDATLVAPRTSYYYDPAAGRWRLVYIFEDVPVVPRRGQQGMVGVADFVVDAHTGEMVSELPRLMTQISETATDDLGARRRIRVDAIDPPGTRRLHDPVENVHTHDFGFRSYRFDWEELPGDYVTTDGEPWSRAAVSAHANCMTTARFLRTVLRHDGVDNRRSPFVSSINCVETPSQQEWRNAAWFRNQMIYGQRRLADGSRRSYAIALDVVAHEIFHGVTGSFARLEYVGESGALNESLSDIFGVVVSNYRGAGRTDVARWNWEIGEDLSAPGGGPLRDMSQPSRFGQPEHMDDFVVLPPEPAFDYGGVHKNSGIHNKAAHLVFTTPDAGGFLFRPRDVVALFHVATTQFLGRTSGFADSRRAVRLVAQTLFRDDPRRGDRLAAIDAAFDAVGIR